MEVGNSGALPVGIITSPRRRARCCSAPTSVGSFRRKPSRAMSRWASPPGPCSAPGRRQQRRTSSPTSPHWRPRQRTCPS
eukprot:12887573-Prorocentrum_lima.AAC.1